MSLLNVCNANGACLALFVGAAISSAAIGCGHAPAQQAGQSQANAASVLQSFSSENVTFCRAFSPVGGGGSFVLAGSLRGRLLWGKSYVAGASDRSDAIAARVDRNGEAQWIRQFQGQADTVVTAAAPIHRDDVVLGIREGSASHLRLLDGVGKDVWSHRLVSKASGDAWASIDSIASDELGRFTALVSFNGDLYVDSEIVIPAARPGFCAVGFSDFGKVRWVRHWAASCHRERPVLVARNGASLVAEPVCARDVGTILHWIEPSGTEYRTMELSGLNVGALAEFSDGRLLVFGVGIGPEVQGSSWVPRWLEIVSVEPDGKIGWSNRIILDGSLARAEGVSISAENRVYLWGAFNGRGRFGDTVVDSSIEPTDPGGESLFLAELNRDGAWVGARRVAAYVKRSFFDFSRQQVHMVSESPGPNELTGARLDLSRVRVPKDSDECSSLDPAVWDCTHTNQLASYPVDRSYCTFVRIDGKLSW